MSLGVCYNGKRKVIVVSPTTKLQSVLEQACEFFNLDANCCKLKKGKAVVDLTIPFRFSSLPPNSSVDIEVSSAPAPSGRAASTRLGFSVEGGSIASFSDTFPSTFTLAQVLDQLVEHGKLPPSATSVGADPVVIYLQSGFRGSQLAETTLANLGLAGQAARLNLRYTGAVVSTAAAAAAVGAAPPSVLLLSPPVSASGAGTGAGTGAGMAIDTDACGQSSPSKIEVPGAGHSPTAVVGSSSPRRLVEPQAQPQPYHPADLLQSLLREHFDAVSKPAVVTIAKYIFNIWGAPLEPKFRVLYFDNKAFVEKIAPCAGAVRFLTGIGFSAVDINGRRALQLALSRGGAGAEEEAEAAVLEPAVRALERALEELAVPFEERPVAPDRALLARRRAAASAPAAVGSTAAAAPAFDPYKTYVRRVAEVNPDGSMKVSSTLTSGSGGSITESRLSALAIRRQELEGEPGDASTMDEPTELLVPNSLADTAAAKTHGNIDDAREFAFGLGGQPADDDDGRMPGDGRLLAASLKDKIQNPSEDAPLTTAALRALKKAQKELVYNRSLVRVRLPDRGVLQRRFHPRHTMRDVYAWVSSCSTEGSAFELYVTPPRQVLAADDTTLHDLQFVPAAIVNLSWRGSSSPMSLSSAAAVSGLLPEVLRGARSLSQLTIPAGAQLVAETGAAGGSSSKGTSGSSSSSSSSGGISLSEFSRGMAAAAEAEGKDSGAGKKRPSWFKL